MSFLTRIRFFQKSVVGITFFFLGLMFYVAVIAHLKKSGSTGMDMTKIQQIRYQEVAERQLKKDESTRR